MEVVNYNAMVVIAIRNKEYFLFPFIHLGSWKSEVLEKVLPVLLNQQLLTHPGVRAAGCLPQD